MRRNMLRQGAAIVMAVLLVMPALPVRAQARKGMAAAAGAEAGYAVEAAFDLEGAENAIEAAHVMAVRDGNIIPVIEGSVDGAYRLAAAFASLDDEIVGGGGKP